MRILLIEDDRMIGQAMRKGLRRERFTIDWVEDGRAAELALRNGHYAMVLLDLGLPRMDGLAVLKELRKRKDPVPIIIVTARDAVADRIEGLNAGADDYVIKPFHLDELVARVRAQLRRSQGHPEVELAVGAVTLNPITHEVTLGGMRVELSAKEFAVLQVLIESPHAVFSREQLEDRLYGWGEEVGSNAVEVHVHNLRKKLGTRVIRNIRGVGYKVGDGT
jgi:DNA-binding response OmpR family regulator